ncbi:ATP-dependent DNA helicase RecG [Bosea sp. BE125]|uniref:ATP-binding protein n=1 Tax=Bosea sp. BE125 TaxID=2817909 RepID=UPI00285D920B|nr:ATP-binding protein [Bosea sp. BE125]MDR6869559.1 ATP-dependent DNA helicase RecG [Bosea sp. BE125]
MDVRKIDHEEARVVLAYDENHFRDLKRKEIAPGKLTQTISAFANTAGGELFIGIEEINRGADVDRNWSGFANIEAANGLLQAVHGLSPLGNFYVVQFLECDGLPGLVLHLIIQKTRDLITSSDGVAYVRRGAQKIPVVGDEALKRLRLDKGLHSFEDETVNVPPDTISNSVTTIEFLIGEVPSAEPEPWLKSQFLLHGDKPTVAGILLFADEPQAALPKRAAIKVFRFKTADEGIDRERLAFDPLTIEGPIYDLISKAVGTTKDIVEGIKRLGEDGLEDISYPDETLHEIITNAVLHRDYSHPTDVQIRVYDDRVEVESPGRLPGHITANNILEEQFARNPKIVRLINKFPNPPNKDVGEGLNTAFEAMRRIRLKDPEITENENSVTVFVRHTRLHSPASIVAEYLDENPTITNQEARRITGIRRDVQMKDIFVGMRKKGVIEQVPGKRGRATAWRKVEAEPGIDAGAGLAIDRVEVDDESA